MGFGREKSTYCYFAVVAACTFLPHDSYIRMLLAKSASIITVADDFFDMMGSLNELEILTDAVQRYRKILHLSHKLKYHSSKHFLLK